VAIALRKGKPIEVYIRRARVGDKIYIDIGGPKWDAYEVTADGWRKIDDPPVCFLRAPGTEPLPEAINIDPKQGIALLKKHTRFQDERSFVVTTGFMIDALGGLGPHAVETLVGESGSTKTTHALMIIALVDPRAGALLRPPRDQRDLFILASQRGLVAYNNISVLDQEMSDGFCTITEGNADARRAHYTNDESSLIYAKTPAILTSVSAVITAGDLAARELQAELAPVPEDERLSEDEFWAAFRKDAPAILGALLGALVVGLRRYPETASSRLPRLATFARFCIACETAFWEQGTFLAAFTKGAADISDDVVRGDPVAASLYGFMTTRAQEWVGTASDLHEELTEFVNRPLKEAEITLSMAKSALSGKSCGDSDDDRSPGEIRAAKERAAAEAEVNIRAARDKVKSIIDPKWPTGGVALGLRLKKVGFQLRSVGVDVTWPSRHGDARTIHISPFSIKRMDAQTRLSQPSPSCFGAEKDNKHNDLCEDNLKKQVVPELSQVVPKSSPNRPQAASGTGVLTNPAYETDHGRVSLDRGEEQAEDGKYNSGLPTEEDDF
jgi:hypothetical protein